MENETSHVAASPVRRLRLLFLHPKTLVDSWPVPVDVLGEVVKFPSAVYPILTAMIADLPIQTEVFDGYVARETFADYKRRLASPDIIAISAMSPLKALDTEVTIRLAKQLNPDVKIVLGGNHASNWPERWLRAGADYVVRGEGEIPFRRLMEFLAEGRGTLDGVPSLFWLEHGQVRRSMAALPKFDLDAAPLPDWSAVDLSRYGLGMSDGLGATVEFSRGCPHRCDFCNINTFWNHKQRTKSVGRMIVELEHLKAQGVGEFIFADDNFAGDERRTVALLEAMIERKLDLRFGCFLRGDTVHRNPDFAALAARAGMRFCMMGIETLDPAWLAKHRKGVRATDALAMYEGVYETLNRQGIFVVGLFITPPQAGPKVASRRVAGRVCDLQYTADLAAIRGSALYEDLAKNGLVAKDMFYHDWNFTSILPKPGERGRPADGLLGTLWTKASWFALASMLAGSPVARRFRWRAVGVVMERLACTTLGDLRRWRLARPGRLGPQQRQDMIVAGVTGDRFVAALARRPRWKTPLALRTGVWLPRQRDPRGRDADDPVRAARAHPHHHPEPSGGA